MQFEELDKVHRLRCYDLQRIKDLKITGECLLHHASGIQFPQGIRINPLAIRRTLDSSSRNVEYSSFIYDYEEEIKNFLANQYKIDDIEMEFDMPYYARKVKRYCLEQLSIEAVQRIIDTNLVMFNKLNEYMAEKNLLSEIEQI